MSKIVISKDQEHVQYLKKKNITLILCRLRSEINGRCFFFFFWSGIFSTCTKMCDLLQRLMKYWWPNVFVPQQLYNMFPVVMSLLPGKHQTTFANLSKLKLFFQEEIRKHKEDRNPSSPRDYIDCYLDEIEKVTGFSRSWHNDFRKSSLLI